MRLPWQGGRHIRESWFVYRESWFVNRVSQMEFWVFSFELKMGIGGKSVEVFVDKS